MKNFRKSFNKMGKILLIINIMQEIFYNYAKSVIYLNMLVGVLYNITNNYVIGLFISLPNYNYCKVTKQYAYDSEVDLPLHFLGNHIYFCNYRGFWRL